MISTDVCLTDLDESFYKSCFARSVAVNSQLKQPKIDQKSDKQLQNDPTGGPEAVRLLSGRSIPGRDEHEAVKFRKNRSMDERQVRPASCMSSRRASFCSSRIAEIPIESIVSQSKVESLQWQLREAEKSREMYKAVMKQVVTFLERTHHSLELLSSRLNTKTKTVPRSRSEHQILIEEDCNETVSDYTAFRDFTWRRPQKPPAEEIAPAKLSKEAFRLLRTAQSLLATEEPKLHEAPPAPDDADFLAQLAREFPPADAARPPQRATSFSVSPKLVEGARPAPAFGRKLSLQLGRARSSGKEEGSSVSSAEDESGFSSMNSFQDVGLPPVGEAAALRGEAGWSSTPVATPEKAMNVLWV